MLFKSILFLLYASIAESAFQPQGVLECEAPINNSDCGGRPILVYTFFSPMVLCHPAIWRGCPTTNKYDNEFQCAKVCIMNNTDIEVKKGNCNFPLNTKRCTKETKDVYTFSSEKKTCVQSKWYGCPSENMFSDLRSCVDKCQMEWVNKLEKMETSDVQQTSKVLNELIKRMDDSKNNRFESSKRSEIHSTAHSYFLLKLQRVNRELEKRSNHKYTNLMIIDRM